MIVSGVACAACATVQPAAWESAGAVDGVNHAAFCAAVKLVGLKSVFAPFRNVKMVRVSVLAVVAASSRLCADQLAVAESAPVVRSMVRDCRSPVHSLVV